MAITIGICGGSASGKSTFAALLKKCLGSSSCVILALDNYYIDFTGEKSTIGEINYDRPESFEIDLFSDHLESLRKGDSINSPLYDFLTHRRRKEFRKIVLAKYILVEGLFLFNLPRISDLIDIKIFINTPSMLRLHRRITRDRKDRGRSLNSIMDQYRNQVQPMHLKYVQPNRRLADVIIDGTRPFSEQIPHVLELLPDKSPVKK